MHGFAGLTFRRLGRDTLPSRWLDHRDSVRITLRMAILAYR